MAHKVHATSTGCWHICFISTSPLLSAYLLAVFQLICKVPTELWGIHQGSGNYILHGEPFFIGYFVAPSKGKKIYKIKLKVKVKLIHKIMQKFNENQQVIKNNEEYRIISNISAT